MTAGIEAEQDRQQAHQQQLNRAVGRSTGKAQHLAADRLQLVPAGQRGDLLLNAAQGRHCGGEVAEPLQQDRRKPGEFLGLGDQIWQQHAPQVPAQEHQPSHHNQQGQGPLQRQDTPQQAHRHIQGHGNHHGAKQHQQHPAQFPGQEP